ncbi:MAG TPA: cellulose binding domain-containing protein [Pseudonocardiaceae bacterium]|nr:cellulose binding domain-containing protein [Pseudonocardiaceae bacterium]
MLSRRSGKSGTPGVRKAAKRLAWLSTGLLVALFVLGSVPTAQASTGPAAVGDSGLKVQDRSHDNDNPDNQLYALYQIINNGTTSVPLSSLTMRYWLTDAEPTNPLEFDCDFAQVNCSDITSKFVVLPTPRTKANTYLEIGFTAAAGALAPGQSSGEIQTRIHHVDFSNFNTTDSYSFISDPSFVYQDTQTVTLYLNGVLVWGVEPPPTQ